MRFKKILTILILLFVSITTFCGCADIEFIRAIDASNTIIDKLVISLNESDINKGGETLSTVMRSIDNDMVLFRNKVDNWKHREFDAYPDLLQRVSEGIKVEVSQPKNNEISVAIEFSDWDMFGLFYGYAVAQDFEYDKALQDYGPFINDLINSDYEPNSYGMFIVKYSILKSAGIGGNIQNFEQNGVNYYEKYKNMFVGRYDINDVSVSQIFAYPDDRLHSNADAHEVEGDLMLLRWDLSSKSQDFEMSIYKITANPTAWYILALILSAVATIIITIVIYKKNKGQPIVLIEKKDLEK